MILLFLYLVMAIAVGMLIAGLYLLYHESKRVPAPEAPERGHKINVLGVFDFDSNRLSLFLIVISLGLLMLTIPNIVRLGADSSLLPFYSKESSERDLRAKLDRLIPPADRSQWMMSFSSCLILPKEHDRIMHYIAGLGFTWVLDHSHARTDRTPNMASGDTVYYYHSRNKAAADILARMLTLETNVSFSTTLGDGNMIPLERRMRALVVHRIGDTCTPSG